GAVLPVPRLPASGPGHEHARRRHPRRRPARRQANPGSPQRPDRRGPDRRGRHRQALAPAGNPGPVAAREPRIRADRARHPARPVRPRRARGRLAAHGPRSLMQIRRTPPLAHPAVWRAGQLGHGAVRALGSGHPGLDAELPGNGWPLGMLTELIGREAGIGELRLLVPVLRRLTRERRVVVLLGPPLLPYAPALADFGIDLDYLVVVEAHHPADRLWAIEQTLRSASFGALLAWLPRAHTRPEHLRRLQSAAHGTAGPVFLFRGLPAQMAPPPAPLRLPLPPLPAHPLPLPLLQRPPPVPSQPPP